MPNRGIFHREEIRKTLTTYPEIFGLKPGKHLSDDEIRKLITQIFQSDDDTKKGAILGFPPGSSINYAERGNAIHKLDSYFDKGKDRCVADGWTEDEINRIDYAFTHQPDFAYSPEEILETLNRHESQLGLSESEKLIYAFCIPFYEFGYDFFYVPKPENAYTARDTALMQEISENGKQLSAVHEFIKNIQNEIRKSQLWGQPISHAKSVWFNDEFDDIPGG
jgi:hypothetical protein